MARPRKKTEEETPKAEGAEAAEGTEELVPEQTPEEAPAEDEDAPTEVAEEPAESVGEEPAPPEETVEVEPTPAAAEEPAAEEDEPAEPKASEESAEEPVGAGLAPPAEAPAAPIKPKRVRRPKEERRARTQSRKARRRGASDGKRKPIVRLPKPEHVRGQRKERRGVVVSNAMEKTIVVRVDTAKPHRRYTKVVRISKKIHAHDEQNEANVGDAVRIVATRPLSKTKHWRLAEVVEQAR